jgi:hypothetical protein
MMAGGLTNTCGTHGLRQQRSVAPLQEDARALFRGVDARAFECVTTPFAVAWCSTTPKMKWIDSIENG